MKVYLIEDTTEVFDSFDGALQHLLDNYDLSTYSVVVSVDDLNSVDEIRKRMAGEDCTVWTFQTMTGVLRRIVEVELQTHTSAPMPEPAVESVDDPNLIQYLRFDYDDQLDQYYEPVSRRCILFNFVDGRYNHILRGRLGQTEDEDFNIQDLVERNNILLFRDGVRETPMPLKRDSKTGILSTLDGHIVLFPHRDGSNAWTLRIDGSASHDTGLIGDLVHRHKLVIKRDIRDDMNYDTFSLTDGHFAQ